MLKETVICIVIVICIFGLDIFTQKYTEKSIETTGKMLEDLKMQILNNETNEIENNINEINDKWQEVENKLAYYIEHNELEKVNTAIVEMRSYAETEDFSSAVAELDKGRYILEHIKDKNSFDLQNIF